MNPSIQLIHLFVFIPPLLLVEGLFSGSEIALLSADRLILRKQARQGSTGARLALELADHPERVLSVTLLLTCLCVVGISSLVSLFLLERNSQHSEVYAVLIASPLVVIFGELIPKTIFQQHSNQFAPWIAYSVHWTYWAFYPITRLLASYTARITGFIGPIEELITGKKPTTREELENLLTYDQKESEIKVSEKKMIRSILDFREAEAKHAMIPLVKVDAIEDSSTVREALELFERHRHSRMPIFKDRIDNIVGVLEAADLFMASDLNQPIRLYLSHAHYVAETQALSDLLLEMHQDDNEMVVVVDEHGGAVGILTFEDIVEEIVGEISDEYDTESLPYKTIGEHNWVIQAKMEIQQINDQLHLGLPQGEYETLSGFLLQQFGRIPDVRDELFFTTAGGHFKFTIRKATQRHIEMVSIERLEPPSTPKDHIE